MGEITHTLPMTRLWAWVSLSTGVAVAVACGSSGDGAGGDATGGFAASSGTAGAGGSAAGNGAAAGASGSTQGGANTGGSSQGGTSQGGASSGGSSQGGSSSGLDASLPDVTFTYDAPVLEEDACSAITGEATTVSRPIDIIFVIDNSGSMGGEISAVQNNINVNFAQIIEASGIDYRVIMLSRHGNLGSESVCIEAPLSGIPIGGCSSPPSQPVNSARFFHYSEEIASEDSLCKILETYDTPDQYNLAPNGWRDWLRADSFKVFVEITDDQADCTGSGININDGDNAAAGLDAANQFDQALTTLDPASFGTPSDRNYDFYSIVALAENTPPTEPWPHTAPVQTGECSPDAQQPGTGYQQLSILTEALRYPSCENDSFDAIFTAIAAGVIDGAAVACEFDIPQPDAGIIDPSKVEVEYIPGGTGNPSIFGQVSDEPSCAGGDGFYFDDPISPSRVLLCPTSCNTVQGDDDATVNVLFGCLGS